MRERWERQVGRRMTTAAGGNKDDRRFLHKKEDPCPAVSFENNTRVDPGQRSPPLAVSGWCPGELSTTPMPGSWSQWMVVRE